MSETFRNFFDQSHGMSSEDSGAMHRDVSWFEALAQPEIYRNHPFRCTGVPALAGVRETAKRLEFLRQALELGTAEYHWAFAPGLAPTVEELRSFGQMLKEPLKRFAYEFFWFWPISYPQAGADQILDQMAERNTEEAVAQWRLMVGEGSVIARHNLAVYFHLQAIAGERVWGVQDEVRDSTWREALAHWRVLVGSEPFWDAVKSRLLELAEPQLPIEIVPLLQSALPRVLALINARLLLGYVDKGDAAKAGWHAEFLRTRHVAEGRRQLELCVRPLKKRLDAMLSDARRSVEQSPRTGLATALRLLDPEEKEVQLIEMLDAQGGEGLCTLSQLLGDAALDCLVFYQRSTGDNAGCLPCFEQLLKLKVTPELKRRIERARQIIESHFSADPWGLGAIPIRTTEHREISIAHGRDLLTIGTRGVKLGDEMLAAGSITGFRHGFVESEHDIDHKAPVVGWWSADKEVVLDTTNFFPADDWVRAEALYNEVLAASQKHLVPELVVRLSGLIKSGEILYVSATTLTRDGVLFSTRENNLNEPQLVPYSQLDCTITDGLLVLCSRGDTQHSQVINVAETWNAAMVPEIVAAVANAQDIASQA